MAITHRVSRLERAIGALPGGTRRCAVCRDGTMATGQVINILGERQGTAPLPCPGCGRDEPVIINYWLAEAPKRDRESEPAHQPLRSR